MGILGGSSKKKAQASNQAYPWAMETFSPLAGYAAQGAQGLTKLLSGDNSGFNAYKDATGFNAITEQGSRGITQNQAAGGLLRSGSTGQALQTYGNTMQDQFANNYMDKLLAQAGLGFNAGSLITGAGQQSTETSKSKGGLGKFMGGITAGIAASDRRLKENIEPLYKLRNGLTVYRYNYVDGSGPHIGVMADEVATYQPEALGPVIRGFSTVNYDKIDGGVNV